MVVLPEPFGPEEAGDGARFGTEAQVVDGADGAVVLDEVLDLDEGHESSFTTGRRGGHRAFPSFERRASGGRTGRSAGGRLVRLVAVRTTRLATIVAASMARFVQFREHGGTDRLEIVEGSPPSPARGWSGSR